MWELISVKVRRVTILPGVDAVERLGRTKEPRLFCKSKRFLDPKPTSARAINSTSCLKVRSLTTPSTIIILFVTSNDSGARPGTRRLTVRGPDMLRHATKLRPREFPPIVTEEAELGHAGDTGADSRGGTIRHLPQCALKRRGEHYGKGLECTIKKQLG